MKDVLLAGGRPRPADSLFRVSETVYHLAQKNLVKIP